MDNHGKWNERYERYESNVAPRNNQQMTSINECPALPCAHQHMMIECLETLSLSHFWDLHSLAPFFSLLSYSIALTCSKYERS
jgi:hypothetical protein